MRMPTVLLASGLALLWLGLSPYRLPVAEAAVAEALGHHRNCGRTNQTCIVAEDCCNLCCDSSNFRCTPSCRSCQNAAVDCEKGFKCVMQRVECLLPPCPFQAGCGPASCDAVKCAFDEECYLQTVRCRRPPCPREPRCRPRGPRGE